MALVLGMDTAAGGSTVAVVLEAVSQIEASDAAASKEALWVVGEQSAVTSVAVLRAAVFVAGLQQVASVVVLPEAGSAAVP